MQSHDKHSQSSSGRLEKQEKDYKNKHNFFHKKKGKDCKFLYFCFRKMKIFTQTKDQYKKETYLNLKNCDSCNY